jgi:hypothetical protein
MKRLVWFVFFSFQVLFYCNVVAQEPLDPPGFSHPPGFYVEAFVLTLSAAEPGAVIYYTLDGSEPNADNVGGTSYLYKNTWAELAGQPNGPMLQNQVHTYLYQEPFQVLDRSLQPNKIAQISSTQHAQPVYIPSSPIFKGTVVKAKAMMQGRLPSKTVTRTYIISPSGQSAIPLPVVASVSIDESKLFNFDDGIYTAGADFEQWRAANPMVNTTPYNFKGNFHRKGDWSERFGHIDIFINGIQVINQDIGIRLSGDSSRSWPSKSLSLLARSEYGTNNFQYRLFDDVPVTTFDRILLRNSGNDFRRTMYRDALAQYLVKDLLEFQAYRPTVTLLNGEYWGILNLRERYDRFYFKNVHNIAIGDLDLLENDLTAEEGDAQHYHAMAGFLQNNSLAIQANYNYIKTQLDAENFRDYFITNIYLANADWPGWNTIFWRKRTPFNPNVPSAHDGRWRTALKDTDAAFGLTTNSNSHNTLAHATESNGPSYPNPPWSTLVIRSLLENPGFKTDFINRFADLLNTYFMPERVIGLSNLMKLAIQPEIQRHIDRWKAFTFQWWNIHIDNIHLFAMQRPGFQREHIREKFGLLGTVNAALDVSSFDHGYIKINTINLLPTTPGVSAQPYPWTGIYFKGVPVTLKAIARPGYIFSHWTGASQGNSADLIFNPSADFALTAVFVPDANPQPAQPIYFWLMDNQLPNDLPLESVASTYEVFSNDAILSFTSSLGSSYPFDPSHPNWRKASMERRNSPTSVNYLPQANNDQPFAVSNMRGLQIKQPFQNNGLENTLTLHVPTQGYKDVKFSMAIKDEGAATGILIDYSITDLNPVWTSAGMAAGEFALNDDYQRIEVDFSDIPLVADNPDFAIRIRFTGPNMTEDNGNRVTLNNLAMTGTVISLSGPAMQKQQMFVYPNPCSDRLFIAGLEEQTKYTLLSLEGRVVLEGQTHENSSIEVQGVSSGTYLLRIANEKSPGVFKVTKR